jgi:hypothetical protein
VRKFAPNDPSTTACNSQLSREHILDGRPGERNSGSDAQPAVEDLHHETMATNGLQVVIGLASAPVLNLGNGVST